MGKYTKEDILRIVEEEDVEFIRLQFEDIFGNLKNVAITASNLEKVMDKGCLIDGSSIEGFKMEGQSDIRLCPDLDTWVLFPWRPQQGRVARLICDVKTLEGEPFAADSRQILKNVLAEAEEMGYTFIAGPKCEFFLFETDEEGRPTTITREQAGYFDMGTGDFGENVRRDIILTLEEMGFEIETSHHENAPGQNEIDFCHDEALKTADNMMTFRLTVKNIAKRHGLHATFMPKPVDGVNGSGMQLNMALFKDGENAFTDASDPHGLSKDGYYFIAGVMAHIKGMTAILNPLVNSYKRLVPGFEAPVHIAWSPESRTPMLRVPAMIDGETHIELRSPDPAANPYLALAVILKAGLEGIKKQQMPPAHVNRNIETMTREEMKAEGIDSIPASLPEALREMEADTLVMSTLGEDVAKRYIRSKKNEWKEYHSHVTGWEIDRYLLMF